MGCWLSFPPSQVVIVIIIVVILILFTPTAGKNP